jgi:hypothetical protein
VVEQLVGQGFQFLFFYASGALYHVGVPRLLVHDFVCTVDGHCSKKRRLLAQERHVKQGEVTEHLGNHFLLFVEVCDESIPLHETKN